MDIVFYFQEDMLLPRFIDLRASAARSDQTVLRRLLPREDYSRHHDVHRIECFYKIQENGAGGSYVTKCPTPDVISGGLLSMHRPRGKAPQFQVDHVYRFGKFNILLIIISGGVLATVIFETVGLSYVLPSAQCDLEMTSEQKGFLASVCFIGIMVSAYIWGYIADTTGRRNVLLVSLGGTWICSVASSFANSYWVLTTLRFFVGLLLSGCSSTVYAYLGEFTGPKYSSRAIAAASTGISSAMLLLPCLAWLILPLDFEMNIFGVIFKSWRLYMIIVGLPELITALVLLQCPETPKFLMYAGRRDEALEVLRRIHRINNGKRIEYPVSEIISPLTEDVEHSGSASKENSVSKLRLMWNQTTPLFLKPHGWITLLACCLQFGFLACSSGMYLWVPEILNQLAIFKQANPNVTATVCDAFQSDVVVSNATDVSDTKICSNSIATSVYINTVIVGIGGLIMFVAVSFIVNKFQKKRIIFIAQVVSGAAGIGLYYANSNFLLTAMESIYLVVTAVCISILNSILVDLYPTNLRAMIVCIAMVCGRFGSISASNLIGLLIDYDCSMAITMMGAVPFVCAFLCLFLPSTSVQQKTGDSSI